jgi:hypothetical protein
MSPEVPPVRVSPGRYHSFTVRIWSRSDSGELTHGEVVHVATRRTLHFREVGSLLHFILRSLKSGEDVELPAE